MVQYDILQLNPSLVNSVVCHLFGSKWTKVVLKIGPYNQISVQFCSHISNIFIKKSLYMLTA